MSMAHRQVEPSGAALLDDPERNKGNAFTEDERRARGLEAQ